MLQKHNRTNPLIGLIALLCATAFAFSCNDHGESAAVPPEKSSGYTVESLEQLLPFSADHLGLIKGKELHIVHFADGQNCNSCHVDKDGMDETLVVKGCADCHEEQLTNGLHQDHCTACHDFTARETVLAGETRPVEFCQKCHDDNGAGEFVYGFFEHKMKSEMSCSACHQPHTDPQVFATDNCANCHGQFLDNPLVKKGHRSCTICHEPHFWTLEVDESTCTACHSAPKSVLEHNIGAHPTDCTECHSPHFYDRSIETNNCSSCHDDKSYSMGRNLPSAHKSCTNCHNLNSWNFKGSSTCASCHLDQGEVISNEDAPAEHKGCLNCHSQHTWRTTYANTCDRCHDLDSVLEHQVVFHQDSCDACHDPHLGFTPPETGNCSGCHSDSIPDFKPASPEMHMVCENCHTEESVESRDFEFAGEEDSCLLCHSLAVDPEDGVEGDEGVAWEDAPMGHTMCTGCHQNHSWEPQIGENSCGVCHSDTWDEVSDNVAHNACDNCHEPSHLMEFVGVENSCAVCHSDVAEQAAELGKDDCTLCHTQHNFEVEVENSCAMCHSDVAEEVAVLGKDDCSMCHTEHGFEPDWDVCSACHTDPPETHEASGHQDCSMCHEMHSFTANADTCLVCHSDREEHFPGVDCTLCHKFK